VELFQIGAGHLVDRLRRGGNIRGREIPVEHLIKPLARQEAGIRPHLLQAGQLPLLVFGKLIAGEGWVENHIAHQFQDAIGVFHQARGRHN